MHDDEEFLVSTMNDHESNLVMKKVSRPLQKTLQTAKALGFEFVLFSPNGTEMGHFFPTFEEEWEDASYGVKEYQVIGEMVLEAESPSDASRQFVDKVTSGELVLTVRNENTDAISDIYLSDAIENESSGGTDENPGAGLDISGSDPEDE